MVYSYIAEIAVAHFAATVFVMFAHIITEYY